MFNRMGLGYTEESQARHRSRNYFTGLIWESLLTDNIVFRSQAAVSNTERYTFPESCAQSPATCEFTPSIKQTFPKTILNGNSDQHERTRTYSFQFINRLEFFLNSSTFGEHNITLKNAFMTQNDVMKKAMPGDEQYELNDKVPLAHIDYYSSDPRYDAERRGWFITQWGAVRNSLSLSDQWRPTRYLTFTPGIAYTTASSNNSVNDPVLDAGAISPSISAAWDATHDGRTVLRASFNKYVDVDVSTVSNHTLGTQVSRRCLYNEGTGQYDRDCVFSGGRSGATVGRPCGPTGIDEQGRPCNTSLVIPKTMEYTVGAEREVAEGLSVAVDAIYRNYTNQYEKSETNQIWNPGGNALMRSGGYRNGRAQTVIDLGTPDGARRRYVGVTASVNRREGRMKMQGSYTWSRLDGTVLDGNNNLYGDIPPRDLFLDGPLADDHRHEIKGNLIYRFTPWLSTSVRYSYYSGLPYSRRFRNDQTNGFGDLKARVGINPGVDINSPYDDRESRLPDSHSLNARVSFNLLPVLSQNIDAFIDVLNVLGLRTVNALEENDTPFYGTATARDLPLRLRFGMSYKY
jgi:hypothetical protein